MESERTEQKTEIKGDNVVIGLDCDTPLSVVDKSVVRYHGLWTPNEGINQRYLKNWADVADKISCHHT